MRFDNSSPIWAQLEAEFARRIVVGEWGLGERMPGVRDLAATFGVNPNTAQRALAELERRGLCRSERTAGRFVIDDAGRVDGVRAELAGAAAAGFIEQAKGFGMQRESAMELISERWGDDADHAGATSSDDRTANKGE